MKKGRYFYVVYTTNEVPCSDPFSNMKTAEKYAQIMNNEYNEKKA